MNTIPLESIPGLNSFFIESTSSEVSINAHEMKERAAILGPLAGSVIQNTMKNLSLSGSQKQALDLLMAGTAVAMITGQQPGFLGGPLYSLHKAMTCISLAENHSSDALPIVPIFWIEDNDHDGIEAGTATLIDQGSAIHTIHCDEMHILQSHIPISERVFSSEISSVIENISRSLPNSEYGQTILQELKNVYQSGKNWSESFLSYMQERCGEFGLLFFSASIARKEGLFKERILHEISNPGALQAYVLKSNETLIKKGMKIQAEAGIINAFFYDENGRHKIDVDLDGNLKLANATCTMHACLELIHEHPEKFSPSVLLRPLIQDSIIPTIGMIVGPGEFGYMSQLKDAYADLNVPMPTLHGRHSATILISSISKYFSKHALNAQFFMRIMNEIEHELSERFAHDDMTDALMNDLKVTIKQSLNEIAIHAVLIDASLQGTISATEHGMEKLIDGMHKKVISSLKKKQEIVFGKSHEAHAWIYPMNHLQERVLNGVSIEARVGKEMFRNILIAIKNAPRNQHLVIDVNQLNIS